MLKSGKPGQIFLRASRNNVNWWRAQCALRGVSEDGDVKELWYRKAAAPNKLSPELEELEREGKRRWAEEVKKVEAKEQERKENLAKLRQILLPARPVKRLPFSLAYNTCRWTMAELVDAANSMDLLHDVFEKGHPNRIIQKWLVIGATEFALNDLKLSLSVGQDVRYGPGFIKWIKRKLADVAKVARESETQDRWNVTGLWRIESEDMVNKLRASPDPLPLTIEHVVDENGRKQMYAKFDFGHYKGYMRFESQEKTTGTATTAETGATGDAATGERKRQAVSGDDKEKPITEPVATEDASGHKRKSQAVSDDEKNEIAEKAAATEDSPDHKRKHQARPSFDEDKAAAEDSTTEAALGPKPKAAGSDNTDEGVSNPIAPNAADLNDPALPQFYLSTSDVPSSTKTTWSYRWRGHKPMHSGDEPVADEGRRCSSPSVAEERTSLASLDARGLSAGSAEER
jgi:hypothetical protein